MTTVAEYLKQTSPEYCMQKKAYQPTDGPSSPRPTTTTTNSQATPSYGTTSNMQPNGNVSRNPSSNTSTTPYTGGGGRFRGAGASGTWDAPAPATTNTSPEHIPGFFESFGRMVYNAPGNYVKNLAGRAIPRSIGNAVTSIMNPDMPEKSTWETFKEDTGDILGAITDTGKDAAKDMVPYATSPAGQQWQRFGIDAAEKLGIRDTAVNHALASFGPSLYTGNIPEEQKRYNYLIQNMLGGDGKSNPYTKYFDDKTSEGIGANYSDLRYLYELMHIMKHNPEASKMFMQRIMSGENTTFLPMLQNLSNTLKSYGETDKAEKLLRMHNYLLSQQGQLGKTMLGPEIQGAIINRMMPTVLDMMETESEGKQPIIQGGFRALKSMANAGAFKTYNGDYSPLYWKTMGNDFYKNNFYGMLNSPEAQGALQYAAPWAAYGIPIASAGSLLGFNGLWLPVLAGGAASGTYGSLINQGYLSDTAHSNVGQAFDNITRQVNGPLNSIMQIIPGFERIGSTLVTQRNLPAGRPIEDMFKDYMKPEKPTQ